MVIPWGPSTCFAHYQLMRSKVKVKITMKKNFKNFEYFTELPTALMDLTEKKITVIHWGGPSTCLLISRSKVEVTSEKNFCQNLEYYTELPTIFMNFN